MIWSLLGFICGLISAFLFVRLYFSTGELAMLCFATIVGLLTLCNLVVLIAGRFIK